MRFRRSLRYRVGLALAVFGGAASLLLSAALFLFFHGIEGRFIDDALDSEIEEFLATRAVNPQVPLPRTSLFRAYARSSAAEPGYPQELSALPPGRHELRLENKLYRVAVVDQAEERLYLLYDESGLQRRERRVKIALAIGVGVMMLLSAAAGIWLAGRVISPVCQLRRRVRGLHPGGDTPRLAADFAEDEVGELAKTFEGYLARLHAFIERERNFTADASHELRTPLTIVGGATEVLLAEPQLPQPMRLRLERIERAVRDMRIVMDGLLALARETDASAAQGSCDVAEVVKDVVDQHRPLAQGKPIDVQVQILARPQVNAQPALVAVAVGNLVRNAIAYTPKGTVTVAVMADRVIVDDTGPGFTETGAPHKGIGLSLVRRVCERFAWKTGIACRPEGGTRAEIVFGAPRPDGDALQPAVSA